MINPSVSAYPISPDTRGALKSGGWNDIARLCRRICVLREGGDDVAAEKVREGALADAIAAIRTTEAIDAAGVDARVDEIFRMESDRVADAAVLAELLAPRLRAAVLQASPAPLAALGNGSSSPPEVSRPPPAPRRPAGGIADFIDAMIAQEHTADSSRRTP